MKLSIYLPVYISISRNTFIYIFTNIKASNNNNPFQYVDILNIRNSDLHWAKTYMAIN